MIDDFEILRNNHFEPIKNLGINHLSVNDALLMVTYNSFINGEIKLKGYTWGEKESAINKYPLLSDKELQGKLAKEAKQYGIPFMEAVTSGELPIRLLTKDLHGKVRKDYTFIHISDLEHWLSKKRIYCSGFLHYTRQENHLYENMGHILYAYRLHQSNKEEFDRIYQDTQSNMIDEALGIQGLEKMSFITSNSYHRIKELEAENEALKKQKSLANDKKPHGHTTNAMLRMIATLLATAYSKEDFLNHRIKKSEVIDDAKEIGLTLDDETVDKYIKQAQQAQQAQQEYEIRKIANKNLIAPNKIYSLTKFDNHTKPHYL